jgi:quercetin dioxygenase-like cupin family protein
MSDSEQRTHADIIGERINVDQSETAGEGSAAYNEPNVQTLINERDAREKVVIINEDLIPAAGELLVDLVRYPPNTEIPNHYHEGTDHFFYVLDGEGVIEIEGEEVPLTKGDVAWIG